jgi:sugar/nucleoside kinase (ribokinase family)
MTVLCIGELMWDLHVEPGESLETGERIRRVPGGAAANVALGLSARGVRAAVAGVVSDDPLGRGLCQALEQRGVDASRVIRGEGRTGLVFLERIRSSGERFVSYRPVVPSLGEIALPEPLAALHIAALNPDAGELDALERAAVAARAKGAWIMVDVNARPRPWSIATSEPTLAAIARLADRADAIKLSEGDLRVLARHMDEPTATLRRGCATLLVTRGAASTEASGPWGTLAIDPPAVDIVRSIGAGDAFCCGLLAHLAAHTRDGARDASFWREAVQVAHASAASRVTTAW